MSNVVGSALGSATHRGCSGSTEGTKIIDRECGDWLLGWLYAQYPKDSVHPVYGSKVGALIDLLNQHLATLPKTKMVEVRRWVCFDYEGDDVANEDGHLILNLKAFQLEQNHRPGQWVTFNVEVPA